MNPAPHKLPAGEPEMPRGLSSLAKKEWKRIVPLLLHLGTLTCVDGPALQLYCEAYGSYQTATRLIAVEGIVFTTDTGIKRAHPAAKMQDDAERKMRAFMLEFGMTAGSRSRIKIDPPARETDPVESFFEGSK
jgi:P27 family predicted phage terminase small subunit